MNIRARFWVLSGLRWLSTGLIIPVHALLPLQRGLTVSELGAAFAVQGIVVLCLELPTGGFADAMGRKPVFLASAVFALASYVVLALADTLLLFAVSSALAGVFRALDSGPLNAWYVDEVIADGGSEEVARGISGAATVIGLSIAGGAVAAGGIVAWDPIPGVEALAVPAGIAAVLALVQIVVTFVLMDEDRSMRVGKVLASVKATPGTIAEGVRLLGRSRVLRALIAVELFWGFGMIAFETLMPIRLSELVDHPDSAGAIMGPVSAAAWGISALGAACVPMMLRRWSMTSVSVALRLIQGAMLVGMGLVAGPAGLIVALLATYAVHTAAGAIYETLLHEQVDGDHRATVLSLASMAMQPAASLGSVVLGAIATGMSTGFAIIVGGIVLAMAAPLFLVKEKEPTGAEVRPVRPDRVNPGSPR